MSDNDDEIEADNFQTSEEKQASYNEQECYKRCKRKSLDMSELRKIFNAILSNYDTCTEAKNMLMNKLSIYSQNTKIHSSPQTVHLEMKGII